MSLALIYTRSPNQRKKMGWLILLEETGWIISPLTCLVVGLFIIREFPTRSTIVFTFSNQCIDSQGLNGQV